MNGMKLEGSPKRIDSGTDGNIKAESLELPGMSHEFKADNCSNEAIVAIHTPLLDNDNFAGSEATCCWRFTLCRFRESRQLTIAVVSLALFTDMVLYDMIVPILPALLKSVGKDEYYVGILFAIYAVGYLIATPIFGVWSDRKQDRKLPMILGQAGLAIATIIFALAKSFWLLAMARLLQGIAAAVSWTLGLALLADSVPEEKLGSAMGIVFGFHTLGYFVGPLMGGILTQAVNMETPFIICSILCFIDLFGRAIIKPPTPRESTPADSKKFTIIKLLKYPEILIVGFLIVLTACSFCAVETLLPSYLERRFGLDVMKVSFCLMSIIIPSVLFSFIGGWLSDRYCRYTIMCVSAIFYAIATPIMGVSPSLLSFILSSIYFGATSSVLSAPTLPEMGSIVMRLGSTSYAQVYAIVNVCYAIGMLTGPILASIISQRWGFTTTMVILSCPFILELPFLSWLSRRRRKNGLRLCADDTTDYSDDTKNFKV